MSVHCEHMHPQIAPRGILNHTKNVNRCFQCITTVADSHMLDVSVPDSTKEK